MDFIIKLYELFLDIVFPSTLESITTHHFSAEHFLTQTKIIETTFYETTKSKNLAAKNIVPALSSITSLFPYHDNAVHEAIWELKYRGNKKVSRLFATLLYSSLVEHLSDEYLFSGISKPLIIPIPSSEERKEERGFNHIALITRELEKLDKSNFFLVDNNILLKTRATLPQATLSRTERLTNLQNSFSVNPTLDYISLLKEKNIILIDDVATTGSTLEEAARVLKHHGTRSVSAFTIAH